MDNEALISIIVPVYNVEKYLRGCVDSIINQTYKNIEIILVDDGSPDNCGKICDEYAKKDNRITVIHKKNGGLSSARNAGLRIAKGEFIGFVDSDDYVRPNMFEAMIAHFDNETIGVVTANIDLRLEFENNSFKVENWNVKNECLDSSYDYLDKYSVKTSVAPFVWNRLYRREVLKNIEFLEGVNAEDVWFNYKVFSQEKEFYVKSITENVYVYRIRQGSLCNDQACPIIFDELRNLELIIKDSRERGDYNFSEKIRYRYSIRVLDLIKLFSLNKDLRVKHWKEYKHNIKTYFSPKISTEGNRMRKSICSLAFHILKISPNIYMELLTLKNYK